MSPKPTTRIKRDSPTGQPVHSVSKSEPPGKRGDGKRGDGKRDPVPPDLRSLLRAKLLALPKSSAFRASHPNAPAVEVEAHLEKTYGFPSPYRFTTADSAGGMPPSVFRNIERKAHLGEGSLYRDLLAESRYQLVGSHWVEKPIADDKDSPFSLFENRIALEGNNEMIEWMESSDCMQFDMIALSAAVLVRTYAKRFRSILEQRSALSLRIVVFDADVSNQIHYEGLIDSVLKEASEVKRSEYVELVKLTKTFPHLRVKVISARPFQYNMWLVRGRDGKDLAGHLSMYFYNKAGGPACRFRHEHHMIPHLRAEFDYVWNNVAKEYSAPTPQQASNAILQFTYG